MSGEVKELSNAEKAELQQRAALNKKDHGFEDPETAARAIIAGDVEKLKALLVDIKPGDLDKPLFGTEYHGLRYAVEKDQLEVAKLLIANGADANLNVQNHGWPCNISSRGRE